MLNNNKLTPVSSHIKKNEQYMNHTIGIDVSYDIDVRKIFILEREVQLYHVNGLVDDMSIIQILKKLVEVNDEESEEDKIYDIIKNRIANQQVDCKLFIDEAIDQLLSGLIIIFVDGEDEAFIVDVRRYPGREPEEPDTERVIRGSRDGFTENVVENTALIRRRVKDPRLRNEMVQIGKRSKTDVSISYIQDIANDKLIHLVKEKIEGIDVDGLVMADKALEEFFVEEKWNPYPLVRYTERPDVAAHHILSGYVTLTVDTSPSIIILPTTFFDHLEHAEEYRQTAMVGTIIRWIRMLAVLASFFLIPIWYVFVMEPTLLPDSLSFIGLKEESNIPIALQIILAIIGVEFLRMAAVHTPTPLATALGLIAAILIGEIAVDVGLFSPEVILYVAISTIGSYVTPSYELSVSNKVTMMFILFMTLIFGVSGFIVAITIAVLFLAHLKTLYAPYLWPLLPFNFNAFLRVLIRVPVSYDKYRPSIVHPKDKIRMSAKQ